MATTTTNLGLIKPSTSEFQDVATINTNMNTIDAQFTSATATLTFGTADWAVASTYTPYIQRVGKVCKLAGVVTKNSGFTIGVSSIIGNIPFGFRPALDLRMVITAMNGGGTVGRPFQIVITTLGDVGATALTDASYPAFNTNTWLLLDTSWLIP